MSDDLVGETTSQASPSTVFDSEPYLSKFSECFDLKTLTRRADGSLIESLGACFAKLFRMFVLTVISYLVAVSLSGLLLCSLILLNS